MMHAQRELSRIHSVNNKRKKNSAILNSRYIREAIAVEFDGNDENPQE